jgi:hypothetical protein
VSDRLGRGPGRHLEHPQADLGYAVAVVEVQVSRTRLGANRPDSGNGVGRVRTVELAGTSRGLRVAARAKATGTGLMVDRGNDLSFAALWGRIRRGS